ncbi:Hint domain-containing protein [Oceanicola sp. 22II-s10i]|uniref:Hint domain-containing protein n=1 Tax=Oceanicola sp. 22II-s10i TaxID=1317116 RepID=UPI000B528E75|nr:Hint domain-containing protein [Oceanicola sp. 22II-s10i]
MTVYISEIRFENNADFVEIVATNDEDLSGYLVAVYDGTGKLRYTQSLAGQFVAHTGGNDGYLVNVSDGLPDMGKNWAVALLDDSGNVIQFLSSDATVTATDGPAVGETSTNLGSITSGGQSLQTDDGGATYFAQSSPNPGTIPCFAAGTLIDTPAGARRVEDLKPGDWVSTLDHGPMRVQWRRRSLHDLQQSAGPQMPILIPAGSLGRRTPSRDLVVSPQHRIFVGGMGQLEDIFRTEALVPAKALIGYRGIREMRGRKQVTWVHFAFDQHEIVTSNGALTESLLIGQQVQRGLNALQSSALRAVFAGKRMGADIMAPARNCMKVQDVRRRLSDARVNFHTLPVCA